MSVEQRSVIRTELVYVIPAVVLPRAVAHRQKHGVIIDARVQRPSVFVIVPRLNKKDARFRSSMWLECVDVKADDCEDSRPLGNPFTKMSITGIVEAPLR